MRVDVRLHGSRRHRLQHLDRHPPERGLLTSGDHGVVRDHLGTDAKCPHGVQQAQRRPPLVTSLTRGDGRTVCDDDRLRLAPPCLSQEVDGLLPRAVPTQRVYRYRVLSRTRQEAPQAQLGDCPHRFGGLPSSADTLRCSEQVVLARTPDEGHGHRLRIRSMRIRAPPGLCNQRRRLCGEPGSAALHASGDKQLVPGAGWG
mmetsp:Transcript_21015/g.58697  ORF Transcript_21015/g.58697 Transcript_21015/m.58697 type:complete len:201 (+) Transcript_21015:102-704(+)